MARKKMNQDLQNETKTTVKRTSRKKKETAPEAVTASAASVETEAPAPKKRGRKPKDAAAVTPEAPAAKRRGRKPKTETAAAPAEPKKRGRKKAAPEPVAETLPPIAAESAVADSEPMDLKPDLIVEIGKTEETPAPAKKTRKPRAKKAEQAVPAEPKKRGRKPKEVKAEPVLTTVLQIGETEFDITDIALKAYKAYKSTHKRKAVTDFRIYVKPEENAAYFTVNGEGSDDFKVDLK